MILLIENCSKGEKKIIKDKNETQKVNKLIIGFEPMFYDYKTYTLTKLS